VLLIRYDSEFAAFTIANIWQTKDKELTREIALAQQALLELSKLGRVKMMHVKGHAGIEGNVNADKMADEGKKGDFLRKVGLRRTWEAAADWDQAAIEEVQRVRGSKQIGNGSKKKVTQMEECQIPPDVIKAEDSTEKPREHREQMLKRKIEKERIMWKKMDGGLWNVNGKEGREAIVDDVITSNKLSYLVITEPKETVQRFRARVGKDEAVLGWKIVGKGRKTGERGGGVWIVTKNDVEVVPIESEDTNEEDDAEIAAAYIKLNNGTKWSIVIGVYVTPTLGKHKYREQTLRKVLAVWEAAEQRAKREHMPIDDVSIQGDLNFRMTKKERIKLEFGEELCNNETHLEGEREPWVPPIDRDNLDDGITWTDPVAVGTYSLQEKAIVRSWIDRGMTIINGRAP